MAPIAPRGVLLALRRPPSEATTRLASSVKKLINLKVVLYVLLGTAAVFGLVLLCWRLGSCIRQFTRGRILRGKKSYKTRYIKTWYGWVPQDRYNSQRKAWKRALGKPWRWFSWTDSNDDYSWVWWSPSCSKSIGVTSKETRQGSRLKRENKQHTSMLKSSAPPFSDSFTTPKQPLVAHQIMTSRLCGRQSGSAIRYPGFCENVSNIRVSSFYMTYLTYPLHIKQPRLVGSENTSGKHPSEPDTTPTWNRPTAQWICFTNTNTHTIVARRCRQCADDKVDDFLVLYNKRRVKRLKRWAMKMQSQRLHSMTTHHRYCDGCPGTPASGFLEGSSDQESSWQRSGQNDILFKTMGAKALQERGMWTPNMKFMSNWFLEVKNEVSPHQQCCNVSSWDMNSANFSAKSLLDDELLFLDSLDRRLEWLLGECQPGRRGFRFPILPRTWLNKHPRIIYTAPCCASAEFMRLHGDSKITTTSSTKRPNDKASTIVTSAWSSTSRTSPHINSWRAQVNNWRRFRGLEELNTTLNFGSSAEEPPDNVLDPSSWILRRPPQGFPMSSKQMNAYYGCDGGKWLKLEDWKMVGT